MRHVIPCFGTPRRLLSDCGREFISSIWTKLLRSLGIQQVLTSPYHPEGNAINERSHRTLNNMLRACLLEGPSTKAWVDKVPKIMLTLNAMPHNPMGSQPQWSRQVANQLFLQTSPLMPAHPLLPRTPQVTLRPSSRESRSLTNR